MDFYHLKLHLLILAAVGCCSAQNVLPAKLSGVVGKNITFQTSLTMDFLSVAWSFQPSSNPTQNIPIFTRVATNNKIAPEYVNRITFNVTNPWLRLGPLTKADGGIYELSLINGDMSPMKGLTVLTVLEPVADVMIIANVPEAIEFNSTVTLTCSAKGSFLSYQWINNTETIKADGKHLILNGSQLIISEVFRSDLRGPIYCTAQNELESQTSPGFNLSVSYGPEKIAIEGMDALAFMKKGSNLTLTCSAQSSPAAKFMWFVNGVKQPQNAPVLNIPSLLENQSGNYSCVAYHEKTLRYVTSQVLTLSVIEAISGVNITGPLYKLIAGNSTANVTCKSSTGKADKVVWTKNGKPLDFNDRLFTSNDQRTISILLVNKEDAGMYTCQLSNKVNTESSTYELAVIYGPDGASIKGVKEVEVVDKVVLTCIAPSHPPATYVWKLNGTVLDNNNAEYTLDKPDYRNSGTYTCEAKNPFTGLSAEATHKLIVRAEGELHNQLSDGAIAGIVIAVLLAVAIIIAVIVRKRRKDADIPSPY